MQKKNSTYSFMHKGLLDQTGKTAEEMTNLVLNFLIST